MSHSHTLELGVLACGRRNLDRVVPRLPCLWHWMQTWGYWTVNSLAKSVKTKYLKFSKLNNRLTVCWFWRLGIQIRMFVTQLLPGVPRLLFLTWRWPFSLWLFHLFSFSLCLFLCPDLLFNELEHCSFWIRVHPDLIFTCLCLCYFQIRSPAEALTLKGLGLWHIFNWGVLRFQLLGSESRKAPKWSFPVRSIGVLPPSIGRVRAREGPWGPTCVSQVAVHSITRHM